MEQTQEIEGLSAGEFLERLKESALLSSEEIDRALRTMSVSPPDGTALAGALVKSGILTDHQVQAICNRNFAELRIGNYEVVDRLGAGGMGTVFKARHRRMKRIVALKILPRSLAGDVTFVQRFQREVETIARLAHPNIVMAYDADEDEAGPFLAMEFVDGLDLASLVKKQGPLSVALVVNFILQAARGLEYAHSKGIIHRDIKPANLLCDADGTIKVTDLGLARLSTLVGDTGATAPGGITQAGGILGTVDYMPPEQAVDAASIDHRADIYSLGATLYFLLTGQPPYQGQTVMSTLLKHREAPIPPLVSSRSDVPAALDAVYRRMIAKAPADRFQTMTEVVLALEACLPPGAETGRGGDQGNLATSEPRLNLRSDTLAAAQSLLARDFEFSLSPQASQTGRTIDVGPASTTREIPLKVLLVEPSRTQSAIIRKYLQLQGIRHVVIVGSGQEALQAARNETPDAIISAMHLADMSGIQLAQEVRAESKPPAPGFVLISSEAESTGAGTLSKCGRAVLLRKPFTPQQLLESLRLVTTVQAPPSSPTLLARMRVLIVDDSVAARLHIRGTLQALGLTDIEEAADGAQAVAVLARSTFDLVVTDYNMPFMDGRGLIGYLKQTPATASVPIIMVTTEQDPARLEAVRRLGVTVCDKSFQPEVVRIIIDQLVKTS
jgi:serine/threonine protein kinase/DNA-binding response OmpR family regulator